MTWEHEMCYGQVALLCGDLDHAEKRFRSALLKTHNKRDLTRFIPKTLTLLAETLFLKEKFDEAKRVLQRSEESFRTQNSGDAYTRGFNSYALAEIALLEGKQDLAIEHFKQAAPLLWILFNNQHEYYRKAREYLGDLVSPPDENEGEDNSSIMKASLLEASMDLEESFPGKDQAGFQAWFLLSQKTQLLLRESGKPKEAYSCASELMQLAIRLFPHAHRCLAETLTLMGQVLSLNLRPDAEEFLQASITLNIAIYGNESEEAAKAQLVLAKHFSTLRRYHEATTTFKTAFEHLRKLPEISYRRYFRELDQYASVCRYQWCILEAREALDKGNKALDRLRVNEALSHFQKAESVLAREFSGNHPVLLPLANGFVRLYEKWGNEPLLAKAKFQKHLIDRQLGEESSRRFLSVRDLPPIATYGDNKAA